MQKFAGNETSVWPIADIHGAEQPHRLARSRRRDWPRGLVGEPEPATRRRPDAPGGLRQVAGAHVVHAGDAGDRGRDGAAAGRCRDLWRHFAYSVSQRTREIGIRLALGARNEEVTRMFVRHGARLAAIGIACGIAVALVVTRLMYVNAVRREPDRSADLRRCVAGPRGGSRARQRTLRRRRRRRVRSRG